MSAIHNHEQTYYDILEVGPDAAQHEIHAAYQRAKESYSPDSPALYTMFTPQEAKELLLLVEEAYATLSVQGRRRDYDMKLLKAKHERLAPAAIATNDFFPPPTEFKNPFDLHPAEAPPPEHNSPTPFSFSAGKAHAEAPTIPAGAARTRFGIYDLDPAFEKEIQSVIEIDGQFLKRIRLYKKVSLEQIIEYIRISKTYLCAIEANDFSALPAPVFLRGFIAQIARTLGLNEKQIADAYMKFFKKNAVEKK